MRSAAVVADQHKYKRKKHEHEVLVAISGSTFSPDANQGGGVQVRAMAVLPASLVMSTCHFRRLWIAICMYLNRNRYLYGSSSADRTYFSTCRKRPPSSTGRSRRGWPTCLDSDRPQGIGRRPIRPGCASRSSSGPGRPWRGWPGGDGTAWRRCRRRGWRRGIGTRPGCGPSGSGGGWRDGGASTASGPGGSR